MQTVTVDLEKRTYPIFIGADALLNAGEQLKSAFPKARFGIVSDENVMKAHGERLSSILKNANCDADFIILPAGEKTKSFTHLEQLVDKLLALKLERNDVIIAFGGGVIGDITGFAASIIRRGINFVQIPTSLLAQVDSSVGGKTGINTRHGKNLVGAFYQPRMVIADVALLNTLSKREFAAGYAEVAKYGLINDNEFFTWLENNHEAVFNNNDNGLQARIHAILTSCQSKASIVARDETETGERALLNLGHTFGHALEKSVDYDTNQLVHGEAVAIGMVLAYRFSAKIGLTSQNTADRVENHLQAVGLPTKLSFIKNLASTEVLMDAIKQDKKVSRGTLTFILATGIGESFIANDVKADKIAAFIDEERLR